MCILTCRYFHAIETVNLIYLVTDCAGAVSCAGEDSGSDDQAGDEQGSGGDAAGSRSRLNQRRAVRAERRYHTADTIHDIDHTRSATDSAAIHKRLSLNYNNNNNNNNNDTNTTTTAALLLHPADCASSSSAAVRMRIFVSQKSKKHMYNKTERQNENVAGCQKWLSAVELTNL